MTRLGKIPSQLGFEPRIFRSRGGRLNHQGNEVVILVTWVIEPTTISNQQPHMGREVDRTFPSDYPTLLFSELSSNKKQRKRKKDKAKGRQTDRQADRKIQHKEKITLHTNKRKRTQERKGKNEGRKERGKTKRKEDDLLASRGVKIVTISLLNVVHCQTHASTARQLPTNLNSSVNIYILILEPTE